MSTPGNRGEVCRSDAAYVLGALSPADRRAFEDHLRDCAACRESVQRLAGMPGLLALTSETSVLENGPPVPASLLTGLLARARMTRRRRRWLVGGALAASFAVLVAVGGTLLVRSPVDEPATTAGGGGATTSVSASPVPQVPMTQLLPGPMTASLELVDKRWGTAITVVCEYDQEIDTSLVYDLTVIDTDGNLNPAGTWRGVPGVTAKVATATAIPRDHIAALEIRLPDGEPILRSGP